MPDLKVTVAPSFRLQLRPQVMPALEVTVAPSFNPIIHVLGRRRYNYLYFCFRPRSLKHALLKHSLAEPEYTYILPWGAKLKYSFHNLFL